MCLPGFMSATSSQTPAVLLYGSFLGERGERLRFPGNIGKEEANCSGLVNEKKELLPNARPSWRSALRAEEENTQKTQETFLALKREGKPRPGCAGGDIP